MELSGEELRKLGVKFFEAGFLDLEGNLRLRVFPVELFDKVASEGYGFDGYSTGFVGIEESDLVAIPGVSTLYVYSVGGAKRAFMICDIYKDDKPLETDPRRMLSSFVESLPYSVKVGLEPEFYLVREGRPVDESSYMYHMPDHGVYSLLTGLLGELRRAGVNATLIHHEVGPGQFEITLPCGDPVQTCDMYVFYKKLVKEYARAHGLSATFMPKPFAGKPGSGLHIHVSAVRNGEWVFGEGGLTEEGRHFLGGLLKYSREICFYTNPTVNSYKRLVPGFEAPVYPLWGRGNRSVLVRIPTYRNDSPVKFEYRAPDSSGNVYLAVLAVLWAGDRGLKEKADPGDEFRANAYKKTPEVTPLPSSLEEALRVARRDPLGKAFDRFAATKRKEWGEYVRHCHDMGVDPYTTPVTEWELKRYFHR